MKEKDKFNIPAIMSELAVGNDHQILQASAFICRNVKNNPQEILDILGLSDDLSRVRTSR